VRKWDVYLANVPFEDLPESKLRPVVILDGCVYAIDCLKMTSHAPRAGEYALRYWQEAGLRKPTTVRISKRLQLKETDFIHRIGRLHLVDIAEIEKRIAL
jgi:hypothetical protein